MILAHKIRLYPNNKQETYFRRACGTRRFAYNWALAQSKKLYEEDIKTSGYDLSKRFNAIKDKEFPWVREVTKWAPQKGIYDAWDALKRWWKGQNSKPRFKKKGVSKDSFYLAGTAFAVEEKRLRVSKLGWVRMAQELRLPATPKSVTISRDGDHWYAAIMVELDDDWEYPNACENQEAVGVDLGIKTLATLSDGTSIENPKWLQRHERKLKRLQKSLSRKKKGSKNRKKARAKLARQYRKVRHARQDFIHKMTSELVSKYRYIVIEDLNVKGMLSNRRLAGHIASASFGEIRRQLEYKAELSGSTVLVVDRFFPSSKTCSLCGHVYEDLTLSKREWECSGCGHEHDRDVNAARNLANVAVGYTETKNAGGEESAGHLVELSLGEVVKLSSMKQESSSRVEGGKS